MMLSQEQTQFNTYLSDFFEKQTEVNFADSMQKLRIKAWQRFLELGLPSRKSEAYQYVKLRHLYQRDHAVKGTISYDAATAQNQIQQALLPECQDNYLVFVNGEYQPQLSRSLLPKQAIIMPLSEAMGTFGSLLQNHWGRLLKEEKDPLALLNAALHSQGAFVYLPPKCVIEKPLQILHLISPTLTTPSALFFPRIQFFAGAHSEAQVAFTTASLSSMSGSINQLIEVNLEEGANFHLTQSNQGCSSQNLVFSFLRGILKKHSSLKAVHLTQGSIISRFDYQVMLTGEQSQVSLAGLCDLKGHNEAHSHVLIEHHAPHCLSNQLFKGVLDEYSRSSFEGKILVKKEAQKTLAYQLNNHLLLSDHAIGYSKPNLEIFADDVKASHGSTTGQLNEDHLFYLRTRGLSKKTARLILLKGFCREVLDLTPFTSLAEGFLDARSC